MKRTLFSGMIGAIALAALLFAQTDKPRRYSYSQEIGPVLIPTTAADALANTVWVTQLTLTEESGVADTCYVLDKQASPRGLFGTAAHPAVVNASATYVMQFDHRKMPSGVRWACTNGTVAASLSFEY